MFYCKAVVVSGRGKASKKMELENEATLATGRTFIPGTLNLIVKKPIIFNEKAAEDKIPPYIYVYPVYLNGKLCWVRRYSQCPFHILEVVSDERLRDVFQLNDGDEVQLAIAHEDLKPISFVKNMLWHLAWEGRELWFYRYNWYATFVSRFLNLRYRIRNILGVEKI